LNPHKTTETLPEKYLAIIIEYGYNVAILIIKKGVFSR